MINLFLQSPPAPCNLAQTSQLSLLSSITCFSWYLSIKSVVLSVPSVYVSVCVCVCLKMRKSHYQTALNHVFLIRIHPKKAKQRLLCALCRVRGFMFCTLLCDVSQIALKSASNQAWIGYSPSEVYFYRRLWKTQSHRSQFSQWSSTSS